MPSGLQVATVGGDKGARDLLAQLQQLSEAASGEMWDHYQSMIRRVQKDILVCVAVQTVRSIRGFLYVHSRVRTVYRLSRVRIETAHDPRICIQAQPTIFRIRLSEASQDFTDF